MGGYLNHQDFWRWLVAFGIVIALLDLGVYIYSNNRDGMSGWPPGAARAAGLEIMTDKREYGQDEIVEIVFINRTKNIVEEESSAGPKTRAINDLGLNYGVGLIERRTGDAWVAVEPVWRCSGPCYRPCGELRLIPPAKQRAFYWQQTRTECDQARQTERVLPVAPGTYRISSAVKNEAEDDYELVHSSEFIIK